MERDPLGNLPVKDVTESHLRRWASRQRLSPHSLRKRLGFLHQLLRIHGSSVRYKLPALQRHDRRPLSPVEAAKVVAECLRSTDRLERLGTLLCVQCGLRRSEAVGLRHEDREGDGIRIRRAVVRVTGEIRVRARTKTAKSSGWVPLPPLLLSEIGNGTGYVLGDGKRPIVPDALTNAVKRVAGRVGVSVPHLGPHALRRTYGMALLEAGVDVVTAADLMRHDPRMLLEEYARTRTDLKVDAIRRVFGDTPHDKPHGQVKGT